MLEEKLKEVSIMIDTSTNIKDDIKQIVKAICRAYIRQSDGKIPLEGIKNVVNTTFIRIQQDNLEFSGENKILGETATNYDSNCNTIHEMSYISDSNYIKLISILTHELGHVITEYNPLQIVPSTKVYPVVKRTTTFYYNCKYDNNEQLTAEAIYGFRMADGFLESICTKIFQSKEFRQELKDEGYDLKDYEYKDIRLFPSRIYDEFKACFELFDYLMDGKLFEFSCKPFSSNEEIIKFINDNKLNIIFPYLDKSNDALWKLKKYENKPTDETFEELFMDYQNKKNMSLLLAEELLELYQKERNPHYNKLLSTYEDTIKHQSLLQIPKDTIKKTQ